MLLIETGYFISQPFVTFNLPFFHPTLHLLPFSFWVIWLPIYSPTSRTYTLLYLTYFPTCSLIPPFLCPGPCQSFRKQGWDDLISNTTPQVYWMTLFLFYFPLLLLFTLHLCSYPWLPICCLEACPIFKNLKIWLPNFWQHKCCASSPVPFLKYP